MDITKAIFETIDIAFNKKQNESFVIEDSDKVVVEKDIQYSNSDPKNCFMDYFFIPKKRGKYPVIFNIHGGGFVAGKKEYRRQLCTWFATNGFFVVNVDYGLCPECKFPTPILQLVDALNYISDHAQQLRLNTSKIIVSGDSAGAYYACMLAALCRNKKLQVAFNVKPKAKFNAAILNCGLYDLEHTLNARMILDINKKVFESYTGINVEDMQNFKLKDYCSPHSFITKSFPPTFLIYAKKDILCKGQEEFVINKLKKFNIYYESYNTKSFFRNHCFTLDWSTKEAKEANGLLQNFILKFANGSLPKHLSDAEFLIQAEEQ